LDVQVVVYAYGGELAVAQHKNFDNIIAQRLSFALLDFAPQTSQLHFQSVKS
jgi:hypothetical protein